MYRKGIFLSILVLSLLLVTQRMSIAGAINDGFSLPGTLLFPTPRLIMIYGSWGEGEGITQTEPNRLWIDRFTEVTWINLSHSDVKIKFGKGTDCKEVTSAAFPALGVRLDPQKCFVTSNSIPPKGTLRFRFKEPGDYKYEVGYLGKDIKEHGDIRVF